MLEISENMLADDSHYFNICLHIIEFKHPTIKNKIYKNSTGKKELSKMIGR